MDTAAPNQGGNRVQVKATSKTGTRTKISTQNNKEKEVQTMARKAMVTRAFEGTKVKYLALNTDTSEPVQLEHTFAEKLIGNDDIMKALNKVHKGTNIVPGKVLERTPFTKLIGVAVEDFIEIGVELDPDTRKIIGTDEETDEC
jgi:hypothetical protein